MDEFILIVDDNRENLKITANILKEQKYKIAIARSGNEALTVLNTMRPVLILLDVMMPDIDGFELISIIRENPEFKEIPIIFSSAKNTLPDILMGFQLGAVDYIIKPFHALELIARVKNHVDLKISKDKVEKQTHELMNLNQTKNQILSVISRDMRTPLATLRMLLNQLMQSNMGYDPKFLKESLNLMELAANESYQVLDNLMYWTYSELGLQNPFPVFFNASELLYQTIDKFQPAFEHKKLILVPEITSESLVYADEEMIRTVFSNMMSNAVKFSHQNKPVKIAVKQEENCELIIFSNHGPVVDDDSLCKAFSNSDYYSTPGTLGEKGTGLGLKICKNFVNANAGKIWATSNPESGTSFYILLPKKRA